MLVIDLNNYWNTIYCRICGTESTNTQGIPGYNGMIAPDDLSDWSNWPVCTKCYNAWLDGDIKPGMTSKQAEAIIKGL